MSALNEEGPTNPQDPLHYAPRRTSPRSELRHSSVSTTVGDTSFDRPSRPELLRRAATPPSSPSAELENAVFQSLRRQMDPEVIPEPPAVDGSLRRRAWLGIGAAVGIAAIAAAAFATLTSHDGTSLAVAAPAQDDAAKPALAQFRSLIVASDGDQTFTHEQSERLLQQFEQWRQKADAGDQAH